MKERRMTNEGLEKRLWLLEREIKDFGKKIDALTKLVTSLKKDIQVVTSVQRTWEELVVNDESGK
jgi:prefoldin subunit 5